MRVLLQCGQSDFFCPIAQSVELEREGMHRLNGGGIAIGRSELLHQPQLPLGLTGLEQVKFGYLGGENIARPSLCDLFIKAQGSIQIAIASGRDRIDEEALTIGEIGEVAPGKVEKERTFL